MFKAKSLVFAALLLHSPAAAQPEPYWLSREKQANVANCVVNIGLASTFLGKAGVAINDAIEVCGKEGDTTAACTAEISGVVGGFGYGAAFISAAAAECRSSLQLVNEHAVLSEGCAASSSFLMGTLGLMVSAGARIKDTCPGVRPPTVEPPDEPTPRPEPTPPEEPSSLPEGATLRPLPEGATLPPKQEDATASLPPLPELPEGTTGSLPPMPALPEGLPSLPPLPEGGILPEGGVLPEGLPEGRRLEALKANRTQLYAELKKATQKMAEHGMEFPRGHAGARHAEDLPWRTDAQNARCAFDVGQLTFYMARAGLMINYAVTDCSAQFLYAGGNLNQAKCVADVGRAIGAFAYTASGIAYAVFECPDIIDNLDSACAGSIINLVAGTAELMANSADISATCAQLPLGIEGEKKVLATIADPERRLSPADANYV